MVILEGIRVDSASGVQSLAPVDDFVRPFRNDRVRAIGKRIKLETKEGKVTASVEEIAQYNMLLTEAFYELLADKGIIPKEEVVERVRKLKAETTVDLRRVQ